MGADTFVGLAALGASIAGGAGDAAGGIPIGVATGIGSFGLFLVALFGIYRSVRSDGEKRFNAYTERVEERLSQVEGELRTTQQDLARYQRRVYQLEGVLLAKGVEMPAWPTYE